MLEMPSPRPEARYGMPVADKILINRHYITGYSYYFRQPKWTLHIIDPPTIDAVDEGVERQDHFRSDYRINKMFRVGNVDFVGSGYHKGHMSPSEALNETEIQNSETFLLSNMSPQHGSLNSGRWRSLENSIRKLNAKEEILETFVVTGPIFNFDQPVVTIGMNDDNDVTIPVPNAYFKSVLAEDYKGKLFMWSFIMKNERCPNPLSDYLVPTSRVEQFAGIELWDKLVGPEIEEKKNSIDNMW